MFIHQKWHASAPAFLVLLLLFVATLAATHESHKWTRVKLPSALPGTGLATRRLSAHYKHDVPKRMIIAARNKEDLNWLALRTGDVPLRVYQSVANLTEHWLHCPPGEKVNWPADCPDFAFETHGFEASAYIQFIVDNYETGTLPDWMLFVHAHEFGRHRGKDEQLFHKLKWGSMPFANVQYHGYTDWECGERTNGHRPCRILAQTLTLHDPNKARDPAYNEPPWFADVAADFAAPIVIKMWPAVFQEELGDMPEWVVEPGSGAEFMVSKERIMQRSLIFWKNALRVLHAASREDSWHMAIGFEAVWHGVLGEPWITQAVSKCKLYECSDDEKANPLLIAPALPDPYMLPHVWEARQAAVNSTV